MEFFSGDFPKFKELLLEYIEGKIVSIISPLV